MFPTNFDESNIALSAPPGMEDSIEPLCAYAGDVIYDGQAVPAIISCWKPTQEELNTIIRTGRVWLYVYGEVMPPVAISGNNPFE